MAAAKASIPDGAEEGAKQRIRAPYAGSGAVWVELDDIEYTALTSENAPTPAEMDAASPKDYFPFLQGATTLIFSTKVSWWMTNHHIGQSKGFTSNITQKRWVTPKGEETLDEHTFACSVKQRCPQSLESRDVKQWVGTYPRPRCAWKRHLESGWQLVWFPAFLWWPEGWARSQTASQRRSRKTSSCLEAALCMQWRANQRCPSLL